MGLGTDKCYKAPKPMKRTKLVRKEAAQLWRLVEVTRQASGSSELRHLVRPLTISGQYNKVGRASHPSIVLYLASEYPFSARGIAGAKGDLSCQKRMHSVYCFSRVFQKKANLSVLLLFYFCFWGYHGLFHCLLLWRRLRKFCMPQHCRSTLS